MNGHTIQLFSFLVIISFSLFSYLFDLTSRRSDVDLVNPRDLFEGENEVDESGHERAEAGVVRAQVQLAEPVFSVERGPQVTFDLFKE